MINSIQLKNFRQHEKTRLNFVPGVNTIVGLNNSGKSTIPEAIEFALYGSRALRDKAKGYVRDGQSDGSAVISLTLAGTEYVVGRDSKNAEVRKDKVLDARYKENVSSYVAGVTGVNQTGFRLGHYVRQKELAAFSSLRPGKRYETIERMLKINAIDKAIKIIKQETQEAETQQRILLATYIDVEDIRSNLDDLLIVYEGLTFEEKIARQDLSKIAETLASQHEQLVLLEKKPILVNVRRDIYASRLAAIEVLKLTEQLNGLDVSGYDELKAQVASLHLTELQAAQMQAKKDEIESLKPEKVTLVEKPILPVAPLELRAIFAEVSKKIAAFKKLKAISECPTCHQSIDDETYQAILATLEKERDIQLQEAEEEYELATSVYKRDKKVYDAYVEAERQFLADSKRLEDLLSSYVEVVFSGEKKSELEGKLADMQTAREKRAGLLAQRVSEERIADLLESLLLQEGDLLYLDKVEDNPELAGLIEENSLIEKQLNESLNSTTKERAHTESRVQEQRKVLKTMEEAKVSIQELYVQVSKKKAMQDGFVLFKRHLTAKIRPLLQQVASTLFHKTTKDRYSEYVLSDDYEISLKTHRGFLRKLTSISGSENDLACLCLRLAIATLRSTKLAGSLGFIILDEISGSFDDERTKQTLEGLLELRDVIPQIINITHKPVEMRYADKLFTVKEINGLTTVTTS